MPNRYASGKNAIAECDRCGFRFKLKQLRGYVIRTKNVNILVCQDCWEPPHPQLMQGLYPVEDPQAIRNPRPDITYYAPGNDGAGGSRMFQWGWNPVGGSTQYTSGLTPNDLVMVCYTGTVKVVTT